MEATWLSLIPPLTVIIAACVTKRISLSLFLGIIAGCIIASHFSPLDALSLLGSYAYKTATDFTIIHIGNFLIGVGVLIALFNKTGAAYALAQLAQKHIKSQKGAQFCSLATSALLSLDDYLSILTTGYTMRPIMDRFKVHPLKLAFLVHTLAGPLVILTPFSSWIGIITEHLRSPQISIDPFFTYLLALPYVFYSPLAIASAWFIVQRGLSFGPMRAYEQSPIMPISKTTAPPSGDHSVSDLLIPLGTLIGCIILGTLYVGEHFLLGGTRGIMDAFLHNRPFLVMSISVMVTLLVAFARALMKGQIARTSIFPIIRSGLQLMAPAITMIILAFTLSKLLNEQMGTGVFLAQLLLGRVAPALLPPLCFIVALLITMATGSSWGTFVVMLPTAISMTLGILQVPLPTTPLEAPLLLVVIGAVLSGAVCGDHLSPFSETTIMAATSTQTDPLEHAYTQFVYIAPAVLCSLITFYAAAVLLPYGILISAFASSMAGVVLCCVSLSIMARVFGRE